MHKKIVLIIIVLVVAAIMFMFGNDVYSPTIPSDSFLKGTDGDDIVPNFPDQTLPMTNSPKDSAWNIFQKYLSYNEKLNLSGVRSVVYKISEVCDKPKISEECKTRMNSAYYYGSNLKKEEFVNIWADQKQIILATDFWNEESKDLDQYGRFRAIIFFIKDSEGAWKLLSFSPFQGGAVNIGGASMEEIIKRVERYTEDKDNDGKSDYDEECLRNPDDKTCQKTDPKLQDTDEDGLWDGLEQYI